jgi:hypothetical protein
MYWQTCAFELLDITGATGDDDALCAADLHAHGHDTAADCVGLAGGLLNHDDGTGRGEVDPVGVLGDVGGRGILGRGGVFGDEEHGGRRGYGDGVGGSIWLAVAVEVWQEAGTGDVELQEGIRHVARRVSLQGGDLVGGGHSRWRLGCRVGAGSKYKYKQGDRVVDTMRCDEFRLSEWC